MEKQSHFGDRLAAAVLAKSSPVCVGLDPRWNRLPSAITNGVDDRDPAAVAAATQCYCQEVIDAVVDVAPLVKPQAAFFEQLGPEGMRALAGVIQHARKSGLIVLLDGKRGDIGSTAEGYADAYLGESSSWQCDALTVNPYLGDDTLEPFCHTAEQRGAGIFILVKTSNPGSGFLQDKRVDDRPIYELVAKEVQSLSSQAIGQFGFGSIGAVVGATYPEQLASLRKCMPQSWILIPGFGAQGGTVDDVRHGFDDRGLGAVINNSRGIIFAYEKASSAGAWQDSVAAAARDMQQQLSSLYASK